MESISIHGWENEHELNNFPFVDSLISDQGTEIPNGLIVDAQVVSLGSPTVRIKSLAITSSSIIIEWTVDSGSESYTLTSTCPSASANSAFVDAINSTGLSYGKVMLGSKAAAIAKKILSKMYLFKKRAILLEPSCVTSLGSNHITGLTVLGEKLRGSVALKEGVGVTIVVDENESLDKTIQINAVGSAIEECCVDNYDPLKSINLILPDSIGNYIIGVPPGTEPINKNSPRETVSITNIDNGIKLDII